ncbi:unnamed protein product [Bursaphelenchus okinawaensis]|uniref:TIL domain-containing protein n=1 Tax=Bursaphelenchus okinawaensis TaxID=465554 RepID=A0A811LJI0_9BILA|nr:unnamed protein product [Bursaphelenchus okinawaensis]CAG9124802.1 unnamed protein product [Bursaphelenchus okinawaensis]
MQKFMVLSFVVLLLCGNVVGQTCQPHSHYSDCGSPCPLTCQIVVSGPYHTACPTYCKEGCVCDQGYALYNGRCVRIKRCYKLVH